MLRSSSLSVPKILWLKKPAAARPQEYPCSVVRCGIVKTMSENLEETHKLTPFETLVLRRFDQIDERLTRLEAKALDTKPIWERALAEIVEVKDRVNKIEQAMISLFADLHGHGERITALEGTRP